MSDTRTRKRSIDRRTPEQHRERALRRLYGIGADDYRQMFEDQDGKCAVCGFQGVLFAKGRGTRDCLVIDHNHETGVIRGLLCHTCNQALGYVKDSPEILKKLLAYLKKHV